MPQYGYTVPSVNRHELPGALFHYDRRPQIGIIERGTLFHSQLSPEGTSRKKVEPIVGTAP